MRIKYNSIKTLMLECTCVGITKQKHHQLYAGATRADKKQINRLVKKLLPDLYEGLELQFYNPCNYYKTRTHIIIVHSQIDHFITYL